MLGGGQHRNGFRGALFSHQVGNRRGLSANENRGGDRDRDDARIQYPNRQEAERVTDGKRREYRKADEIASNHQLAPINAVGERAADEPEERKRTQLERIRNADGEGRTRQVKDEQRDRDESQAVADNAQRLTRVV